MELNTIYNENCLTGLAKIESDSIHCCVTSPPYYGLRDYGHPDQIGLEKTPEEYVANLVAVFREVKRVLKKDGTLWLNLGDSYFGSGGASGQAPDHLNFGKTRTERSYASEGITRNSKRGDIKPKDLIGIPWMVAFALRADGWWLRQDIIWSKRNPMPESVTDRCTKSHEYIFLLSKSAKYYYDAEAIKEPSVELDWESRYNRKSKKSHPSELQNGIRNRGTGRLRPNGLPTDCGPLGFTSSCGSIGLNRNKRSVWEVNTTPYKEAHFATFPQKLIIDCIKAGSPLGGVILDPFMGAGTTGLVARKLNRNYIGFELNADYVKIANKRIHKEIGLFI